MAGRRGVWADLQREQARRQRAQERARRLQAQTAVRAQREWERQRREQERQAAANTQERKRLYVESRKAEAAARTAEVHAWLESLESLLVEGIRPRPGVTFTALRQDFQPPRFVPPADLARPQPPPDWESY